MRPLAGAQDIERKDRGEERDDRAHDHDFHERKTASGLGGPEFHIIIFPIERNTIALRIPTEGVSTTSDLVTLAA